MSFIIDPYRFGFVCPDADATAFILAAGITDLTQKQAICTLVSDLKSYGIWNKMKAIYPFVGGTSTTHKFNLKDPRDIDAAFRLVFNGGWTQNNNGAISNGTNGWANTFLNPNSVFGSSFAHQSIYLRNNTNNLVINGASGAGGFGNRFDFGYDPIRIPFHAIASPTSVIGSADSRTDGFVISFRTGTTTGKFKRNNVDKITTLPVFISYDTTTYAFGARNQGGTAGLFNQQELAFASIGDGLTDTEAANFYTAVQAYQTTLGRQV